MIHIIVKIVGMKYHFNSYYAKLVEDPVIISELDKLVTFQ